MRLGSLQYGRRAALSPSRPDLNDRLNAVVRVPELACHPREGA